MILGIHASVVHGLGASLTEAQSLGVNAMQILPYRRHHLPSQEELSRFRAARKKTAVSRLFVHSRFVPCLASSDAIKCRRSTELLAQELSIAAALDAQAFVLHAGTYSPGDHPSKAEPRLVHAIREAVLQSGCATPILLENVPGGGRRMGASLEQLSEFLQALQKLSISCGLCLDTAHAWAAGYDVASQSGMDDFLRRAEEFCGVNSVRLFHLNDTRAARGSHMESHWHWGQGGYLSQNSAAIASLLARPNYADITAIVETPKELGADRKNLDYLKRLLGPNFLG